MSGESSSRRGALYATLREIEPGLYSAEYPDEINPDHAAAEALPDRHIGTDPSAVRQWVEEMATSLGFSGVVWKRPG